MRNMFPDTCYKCGAHVPTGYGFFELIPRAKRRGRKWRCKCVKCADGRDVKPGDREVHGARNALARWEADHA